MRCTDPDEHATARPLAEDERADDFDGRWSGGALKRVPRPDDDGFTVPADADDEPPIAALFDSYDAEETT